VPIKRYRRQVEPESDDEFKVSEDEKDTGDDRYVPYVPLKERRKQHLVIRIIHEWLEGIQKLKLTLKMFQIKLGRLAEIKSESEKATLSGYSSGASSGEFQSLLFVEILRHQLFLLPPHKLITHIFIIHQSKSNKTRVG
jgi:hypothetical protein